MGSFRVIRLALLKVLRCERALSLAPPPKGIRACLVCGCTDERACINGCFWAGHNLCSACWEVMSERRSRSKV